MVAARLIRTDGQVVPWASSREKEIMDLLGFLGRHGHQDAESLARRRSVRWIELLAVAVGDQLQLEADAMKDARARSRMET